MRLFLRCLGVLLGIIIIDALLMMGASELGGEVVTLIRPEPDGSTSEIRLWIVDADGHSWIEHGDGEAFWINRLTHRPEISLVRDGNENVYRAVPDLISHGRFHQLRREQYGIAAMIVEIGSFGLMANDRCTGVPVRLD